MKTAQNGDTVKIHYTGTLEDGTVFGASAKDEPLEFKIGAGQLLQGIEDGVIGLSVGDFKKIFIPAAEGYGLRQEKLVQKISYDHLQEGLRPGIGEKLQMQTPEGEIFILTVVEVSENDITIDANHELAGENLHFNIELVEIL